MDSTTKRRLFFSFISSLVGRASGSIIQFIQIPVFLHFWNDPLYGEWIIINAIPTWLTFSSVGFGTVAGNEMTMMVAREDREGALRVFQSCWALISGICTAVILLLSGALYFLPVARLLKFTNISESDTKWIIFYLGVAVLFSQLEQLLQSAYRSIGRYPYGSMLKSAFSLFAFACTLIPVIMGKGPRATALVFAAVNIFGTIFFSAGQARHPLDRVRLGPRQLCRNTQARRPRHRLHGLPHRQRPQHRGNCARRRIRPRPG